MEEIAPAPLWWRSPRLVAATACFVLGAVVLGLGFVPRAPAAAPATLDDEGLAGFEDVLPEAAAGSPAELVVYVTGAVAQPEVYQLPAGARVKDVVTAAGGFRADAAREQVNLAEPLSDAQHVHIPQLGEADAVGPAANAAAQSDGLIDLNRADAAALEELPGVGATLAERIVVWREEQGPFTTVEELREVAGIGEKLFAQVAPLVAIRP